VRRRRRGRTTAFDFNPGGADVPPVIRLRQGVRGAKRGRCVVRLEEERGAKGKPKTGGDGRFL
jgi:hypothetical protein